MKNRVIKMLLSKIHIKHYLVLLGYLLFTAQTIYSQKNPEQRVSPALLPIPQQMQLSNNYFLFDESWTIRTAGFNKQNDPAYKSFQSELKERFGLSLKDREISQANTVELIVKPGSVKIGKTTDTNQLAIQKQAYRLKLDKKSIVIEANDKQGLFYGVQTFIQLIQENNGVLTFAAGEVTDWPDMELRLIYWDDAHHLERLAAMKRTICQASFYKINAFALKLEGHFQFTAAKSIVEPYAYSPAEFQELTDYARTYFVELIPYLDAPAHLSFLLKHPEYTGLRTFPNVNYELDVTNPKAEALILGMVDNLLSANKGGKYFFLSTDEAYYVGHGPNQKKAAQEAGSNGKLLAKYITRISNIIHDKGRKVIIWGEYPLVKSDITSLPSHLINGINSNSEDYGTAFKDHGIRHLVFTSAQGMEPIFPNYYKLPATVSLPDSSQPLSDDELAQGDLTNGRVAQITSAITSSIKGGKADLMGVVVCGWADSGLNPETFWLGYATGLAAAWNNNQINVEDLSIRFYKSFYGPKIVGMERVYQLLSTQAQFWKNSWPTKRSSNRTPIIGTNYGLFDIPQLVSDHVLPPLSLPGGKNLFLAEDWNVQNAENLELAEKYLLESDELLALIQQNFIQIKSQHYNLLVLYSVAKLCRQNLNMLLNLKRINTFLNLSSKISLTNAAVALSLLDQALDQVFVIHDQRNQMLQLVTSIWYQDWYPRVSEANGRKFLDQVDDIKDHPPVRTIDMSYLIYRQLKYPLGKWANDLRIIRNQFAESNNLPASRGKLDWDKY